MLLRHMLDCSFEEIQQHVLDKLGEHPEGCSLWHMLGIIDPHWTLRDWRVLGNILMAMRRNDQITPRYISGDGAIIYRLTTHSWLAWARTRQDRDAAQAPARL